MAKFGIQDIINIKDKGTGGNVTEYKEIWLSPYEVKPSEDNFYSQENIEELADSFLAAGQQQPTVLGRVNGEFIIVSGHRRNLANILNVERGHVEYRKVRYLYKDMTPAMLSLSLVMGNAYNRELSAWEKTRQAQKLKEALIKARDEDGLKIPGRMRDVVAGLMNESGTNIARMESIQKKAIPEIKEALKEGTLGISAAYEASRRAPAGQKEVAAKAALTGGVRAKEVVGMMKKEGRSGKVQGKENGNSGASGKECPGSKKSGEESHSGRTAGESNGGKAAVKEPDSGNLPGEGEKSPGQEKPVREQLAAIYGRSLEKWAGEQAGAVTKASLEAIGRVSGSDTPQEGWTDTEWAVFFTWAIMLRADCISREDIYLLREILARCGGEMAGMGKAV